MPFGLLTGLGAALSWGTMDIAIALASRRIGSLRVTAGIQLVCAVFLVVAAIAAGTTFPTDPLALGSAAVLGLIGAAAYLAYFTGLRIGPISVVSGMVAAYGGLTVVLSVVVRGESLTPVQALGATVATIGVILTGVAFGGGLRGTRFAGPGVIFSVIALVMFALMAITMDIALESADWIQVLLVSRLVIAAVSIVAIVGLAVAARRAPDRGAAAGDPVPVRRVGAMLLVAGALDAAGLIAFAIGLSSAPTWMVGLASSFGPAVTILVAVAFLGERLKGIQWLGLVGVVVGMVVIGLP
ncbi:MAG: DMT family transporter [Candidatus Limnocylindrales bacterium]|nr:DMT family transporter [Candidatus Limnocylindrales bacterium]